MSTEVQVTPTPTPTPMQGGPQRIACTDGCGRSVGGMAEAEQQAWRFLEITKRYRCPTCVRELDAAGKLIGKDA